MAILFSYLKKEHQHPLVHIHFLIFHLSLLVDAEYHQKFGLKDLDLIGQLKESQFLILGHLRLNLKYLRNIELMLCLFLI